MDIVNDVGLFDLKSQVFFFELVNQHFMTVFQMDEELSDDCHSWRPLGIFKVSPICKCGHSILLLVSHLTTFMATLLCFKFRESYTIERRLISKILFKSSPYLHILDRLVLCHPPKGLSIFEQSNSHIFLPQSIYQSGRYYLFK